MEKCYNVETFLSMTKQKNEIPIKLLDNSWVSKQEIKMEIKKHSEANNVKIHGNSKNDT